MAKNPDAIVKIDVSFHGLGIPVVQDWVKKEMLRHLAMMSRAIMHRRIRTGKNVGGSPFEAYKPGYAKWKAKKGRKVGAGKDWLVFSGQMLAAHQITELTSEYFILGFTYATEALKAWVNQVKYKRYFIGLTEAEKTEAINNTIAHARAEGWI